MALFKSKQKEFSIEDLNSPVLNKVVEFNAKSGNLAADIEKNLGKIKELTEQLNEIRNKYAETYKDEDLKLLIATETELTALKNVVKTQQDLLSKGKRKYVLSSEEEESLKKSFAPIRKNRDELVKNLHIQLAEVEKTLDELKEEQDKVHEIWSRVYGQVFSASQENWGAGVTLNKQTETVEAQNKLNQLANHKGLYVHLWHV